MRLRNLGWDSHFEELFEPFGQRGLEPGRVAFSNHGIHRIHTAKGVLTGELAGRLRFETGARGELPAVGDWVAVDAPPADAGRAGERPAETCVIHQVLPRRTAIVRRSAGPRPDVQVLAANVDAVFVVAIPVAGVNQRSLERYLALVRGGGAEAVIVLSKADLLADVASAVAEAREVAGLSSVIAWSAVTGVGRDDLQRLAGPGRTVALLGPSGAGKSTLVNALAGGQVRAASEVRESDGRGRHTSTSRELILLPSGGVLIDTPGLREVGVVGGEETLDTAFGDVAELALKCRFRDCRHEREPGCAVREAVGSGTLDEGRLAGYGKLRREEEISSLRAETTAALVEKSRWKGVSKIQKKLPKKRRP